MNKLTLENLDDAFDYHAPKGDQVERYVAVRLAAKELARVVLTVCPDSADRASALRMVRQARMEANAAIATEHLK